MSIKTAYKLIRWIILIGILFFSITSFDMSFSKQVNASSNSPANWTILGYFDADCDLEIALIDDFNEMEYGGGSSENTMTFPAPPSYSSRPIYSVLSTRAGILIRQVKQGTCTTFSLGLSFESINWVREIGCRITGS